MGDKRDHTGILELCQMIRRIGQNYGPGNQATKPSSTHQWRIKNTMHIKVGKINIINKRCYDKYMNHPKIITRKGINHPFPKAFIKGHVDNERNLPEAPHLPIEVKEKGSYTKAFYDCTCQIAQLYNYHKL